MPTKKRLVALTGAGISAESGLTTFRDSGGLWEGHSVYDVATPSAFYRNPQLVLDFYNMRRRNVLAAQPNAAHLGLVELERQYDVIVVTQNIDDLHERAGSSNVMHLHGEILKARSINDDDLIVDIRGDIQVGDRAPDGAQLRPHVVWFEESVPMIEHAAEAMRSAEVFVLIGTSLAVYPAAGLLDYVDAGAPKYILDKTIPRVNAYSNVLPFEMPATEGMAQLLEILLR